MSQMSGPRKIVELPSNPGEWEPLQREAHHLHNGKLWRWAPAGCVLCIESGEPKDQTLQSVENPEFHLCQNHGELEKVPYLCDRKYTITIGHKQVEGSRTTEDFFLFPKNQTPDERQQLIEKILSEAMDHEVEHDDPFSEE